MKLRYRVAAVFICVMLLLTSVYALADGAISTRVIMRVSKVTQSAVVNVGEDLTMEVQIDGVAPAAYQWYFNDTAIDGARQNVYTIANAVVEDGGVYRLDAFDESGKMLVSMDISARVIDNTVPKSGDDSMPVEMAIILLAVSAAAVVGLTVRKRRA